MTPRSLAGLALTVAALMSAFVLMAPTAPGLFVGVLTVGTFGFGPFYGEPSRQLVDRPWRRDTRWRDLARRVSRLSRDPQHRYRPTTMSSRCTSAVRGA